ncbi:DUF6265 family protein [Robiginitalea sediminis]|uniref:DUF6265 family protein n=1 Tax=Robiginitalea sediminis TaxID=1982593 RepID=UPI0011798A17|nr:DUF6265 family protein [Robiginitalea sediminis]
MSKITLLPVLLILACTPTQKHNATPEKTTSTAVSETYFDWLVGRWERVGEELGKATYEFWEKAGDSEYTGFGFTLQDQDTIWQENMRLKRTGAAWALHVQAPEDPEPVVFFMTEFGPTGFTCENPELEFPKKIQYWKEEAGLHAAVSNTDMQISFAFRSEKSRNTEN